jgi:hypothetical protein
LALASALVLSPVPPALLCTREADRPSAGRAADLHLPAVADAMLPPDRVVGAERRPPLIE